MSIKARSSPKMVGVSASSNHRPMTVGRQAMAPMTRCTEIERRTALDTNIPGRETIPSRDTHRLLRTSASESYEAPKVPKFDTTPQISD